MLALIDAKKAGLLAKKYWLSNFIAGLVVSIIAVPLAMAFAIASGAKPEHGIYTAIIAGFFVSVFGGSRVQIAGPTGAFIMLLSSIAGVHGMAGLQIATIMAGIFLVCMGLAKFGSVIKFIPKPVIVGFTAGIGVVIWVGQWQYFFGLPNTGGEHFHEKIYALLLALPDLHLATLELSLLSLLAIIFFPKIKKLNRIPSPLVAMVLATLLQSFFQHEGVATIGNTFGGIPQTLPPITLPKINVAQVFNLIFPAFTIAMLGAIESLLSAVVADGMTNTKHDSNQELVGQGLANIFTPLFSGIAATGAIARTATNIRNGGNSPLAGIFHCLCLLFILFFLAPLAANIPLSAMAAILFVVSYNMSDVKHFVYMLKQAPRADVIILLVTFFLTIFTDLVVAVNVGVVLSVLYFMKRMSNGTVIYQFKAEELSYDPFIHQTGKIPDGLVVYSIEGPLFFGAVENFEQVLAYSKIPLKVIILRLHHAPFVDITAIEALKDTINKLKNNNIRVLMTEANKDVAKNLHKSGIFSLTGQRIYWRNFSDAMTSCRKILADEDTAPVHHIEYKNGKVIRSGTTETTEN